MILRKTNGKNNHHIDAFWVISKLQSKKILSRGFHPKHKNLCRCIFHGKSAISGILQTLHLKINTTTKTLFCWLINLTTSTLTNLNHCWEHEPAYWRLPGGILFEHMQFPFWQFPSPMGSMHKSANRSLFLSDASPCVYLACPICNTMSRKISKKFKKPTNKETKTCIIK